MLDTPRSAKMHPRSPGAGARAVLVGYLLRSGARDKAAVFLERLDPEATAKLVSLLDGEELRQMAALCFSEPHIGRTIALDVATLIRLCKAGDHDDVEHCLRRLPTDVVRRVLPALSDARRRALAKSFSREMVPALPARDRFWGALKLRRLFRG